MTNKPPNMTASQARFIIWNHTDFASSVVRRAAVFMLGTSPIREEDAGQAKTLLGLKKLELLLPRHNGAALAIALIAVLTILSAPVAFACDEHRQRPTTCTSTTSITGVTRTVCR